MYNLKTLDREGEGFLNDFTRKHTGYNFHEDLIKFPTKTVSLTLIKCKSSLVLFKSG